MLRIVCIGECMAELAESSLSNTYSLGFAGDTYNAAVYCKRILRDRAVVAYLTAVGSDPLSTKMLDHFRLEEIDRRWVRIKAGKQAGLYFIENDVHGERSFYYYRSDSAARRMFAEATAETLVNELTAFDLIYLSGITLAILDSAERQVLYDALQRLADGRIIAFDPNYRSVLWPSAEEARQASKIMGKTATIVLTGSDDETTLWHNDERRRMIDRWLSWGCQEVVVKDGVAGCLIAYRGEVLHVPVLRKCVPVDTTGAGDSFCAAYLCGRLQGLAPRQAGERGHRLAQRVVMHKGGVIPRDATELSEGT
ncbi:sugar kinase [Desulfofustis glycolicus]|uniref:2-dehydro-3-deoxygluconokinase n=1 Tax=Desulfofustis glycolicus DSM 9705 TaxID=1121409 RepID=A0A1M5ULE7_9BACT|nr:sugar kinase [Desulfofustis glycolicus]MCB2217431.1 sugar kinase [Desulfobulbaceae bacterium]SHH63750.1 2-dehydro-3-deoxygluconokinase [Desulfofustis glycolicus DSM 9705]